MAVDTDAILVADNITVRFDTAESALTAVDDISFKVQPGEFLSLIGPSGCGKSTLFNVIGGLLTQHDGIVTVDGKTIAGPHRSIGMVFQEESTFPWRTVIDNVRFPIEVFKGDLVAAERDAVKLLEMTGLLDFKHRLPEQLSGGMAQRVSLCRALITNPELLLMDEPFSALDAMTRDDMGLELQRVWEQYRKTVIFVTHSIREAVFLSDRVIVLSPRPAVVVRDVRIELSRPRMLAMQETTEFNRHCAIIRASLGR